MDEFIQAESPSVKYHRTPPRKPLTTKEITMGLAESPVL